LTKQDCPGGQLESSRHAPQENPPSATGAAAKLEAEAVSWYREAAEQGNAAGQYNLGRMYAAGKGVPQSAAEANAWFEKAAKQGHLQAKAQLKR